MVAKRCGGAGMEVAGYDPYISSRRLGVSRARFAVHQPGHVAGPVGLHHLHVPLMDQTKGMLNRDKFALMKKGVRIVNLARGGLVKNADCSKR